MLNRTKASILAQAEQAFTEKLTEALRPLEAAEDIKLLVSHLLGEHLQASRVAYFEVTHEDYVVFGDYSKGAAPFAGRYPLRSFGAAVLGSLRAGKTTAESDVMQLANLSDAETAAYASAEIRAYASVPLVKNGQFVAGLVVQQTQPRVWTSIEIALLEDTAERTWAAVERARSARQLLASERLRRVALDAAELGVWSVYPADRSLTTDPRFRMIFHGSPDPLTYDGAVGTVHPEDEPRVAAAIAASTSVGGPEHYSEEYRVIWPDGSQHWVLASGRAYVIEGANGRYVESLDGTLKDITHRKLTQEHTRETEERASLLFEAMSEGAFVLEVILDERKQPVDYRFLSVNPAFERQSGLKDAVGKTALELVPNLEQRWIDFYGRVAHTGTPEKIEITVEAMGGRWWDVSAYRLGGAGSLKVAALFTDITERKQFELVKVQAANEVQMAHELLKTVADGSSDAIAAMDTELRFTFINALFQKEFFTTFGSPVSVGQRLQDALAHRPQDQHKAVAMWQRALGGERFAVQDDFGDLAGHRRSWHINLYPLRNAQGDVVGAAQNAVDMTERLQSDSERERMVNELQEQDQRKNEFLAMLSHELRNPLAPISNAVHLLKIKGRSQPGAQGSEDPVLLQASSIIERQVGQLKRLVDDLLEVSRITTGRIQMRLDLVSLADIVKGAVETVQLLVRQRQHELLVTLPEQPMLLQADAARLEQVLVNLLTNAAKYSDNGGRIQVAVTEEVIEAASGERHEAVLRVRDTGLGITPELLPRVFDLFTQAERSLDRSEGGLGIGLALVKRLVELHHGSITVTSELGRGSEFEVRLPMATAGTPADITTFGPATPIRTGRRVLVVDDNVDSAESLAELLRFSGHEVCCVHDGATALASTAEWRPGVVLLDIGLPHMDGYEVAKRIREQDALDEVVLVALTGYGQESDFQQSRAAGFDHHLVKPADFTRIQEILSSVE
jgi:signal transduction histidine kinase